ncbi:MAG: aldehyde ferredoxin oxidoreductase family protein [Deltaproteobacteria bacterium]|nr:aldehyde ferredoxin oxidoreductase family protein [Deltaproteobacteria bacterium]
MSALSGRVLDIDLSSGKSSELSIPSSVFEMYLGGRGIGARMLFDMLPAKVDPLSEDNLLVFLTGPLSGTKVPGSSKFVVVTKSPLTQAWCDSYSSGRLSIELRKLGYEGMVVRGRSNWPCYLRIDERGVLIKDARFIWGKDSFEVDSIIKETEKSPLAGVTSIGPAGENLCKFACINSELYRQAGRGGVGAVMGSKNLKAIIVSGRGRVEQHDRKRLVELNQKNFKRSRNSKVAQERMKYGTPLTLNITHMGGILPRKNFQFGTWTKALGKIDAQGVNREVISHKACISCFTPCGLITRISNGPYKGHSVEGPEYETLSMLGSNLEIDSLNDIIEANILCDSLGLDTISTGNVIGFVMECFDKGLLSPKETGGLDLRFGDGKAALSAIELIAKRLDYGDRLAEGVRSLAREIGRGSDRFAMHVKGLEFPGYEPRGAFGSALSYAVSPRGACHRRAWPPAREILGDYPPWTIEGKGQMIKELYDENCILHSLLVCDLPAKFIPLSMEDYAEYFEAVTGVSLSQKDLPTIAGRIETLIRMFNLREGLTKNDDTLPYRTLYEPLPDGPSRGKSVGKENLEYMIGEYYESRGWDPSGVPGKDTLRKYGLEDSGLPGEKGVRNESNGPS